MAFMDKIKFTKLPPFAELYEITVGSTLSRFTSYSKDVDFGGNTYLARPIKRGNFTFTKKLRSIRVTVSAPLGPFGQQYVANVPPEPINIRIVRVFQDGSGDSIEVFDGEVISVRVAGNAAHAEVESSTKIFRNKIPRIVYQAYCNWYLFDPDTCGLNEATYQVPAQITLLSPVDLQSSTFDSYDDGYFKGGHVEYDGDIRMILDHVADQIEIHTSFDSRVQNGVTVNAYPGCDKAPATCVSKFNNFDNFCGMCYIPSNNPVIHGIR